jgi:type III secretion system YscQ/HrcQ family protein
MAARVELQQQDIGAARQTDPIQTGAARGDVSELHEKHFQNIEPASRDAINAWLDARGATHFHIDDREFELAWTEPSLARMQFGMELLFGPHQVLLALDGFAAVDPLLIGDPFALMPEPLRDLVVQRVLAGFLAMLPASVVDAADVRAIHWRSETLPAWDCMLGFTLRRVPGHLESQGIIATASPAALAWLHEKLPVSAAAATPDRLNLPVPLTIELGRTCVAAPGLRALGQGDVIWIETARPTRTGLMAQLRAPGTSSGWSCRVSRESLHIVAAQRQDFATGSADSRDATMNADRSSAPLEVPVTFDLGELQVPVQELERMQPGRLFELPQQVAQATVNLRVSGKLIAEGRLVTIGKRIGVRIAHVRMERQSDEPSK